MPNCSYKELTPILSHGDIMKKHLKNIIRKFDTEDKSKYDYVLNQSERIKELEFFDWNRFKQSLTQEDFFLYPNTYEFRKKLSKYYNTDIDNLFLCKSGF